MNHPQPELARLLGELRDGPVLLSDGDETEALRARLLPALRAQVRATPSLRRRERQIRALLGTVAVGTAGLLLWLSLSKSTPQDGLLLAPLAQGGFVQTDGSARLALNAAVTLEARGELAVSESASLTTPEGVQLALDAKTRVGLDQLVGERRHSRLRLVAGKVSCTVPPLGDGSFSVVTRDAEIVVHGTRFTVEVSDRDQTCVRVAEGLVEVRGQGRHAFLHPGSSFGCEVQEDAPEPVAEAPNPAPLVHDETRRPAVRPAPVRAVAVSPAPTPEPETLDPVEPPVGTLAEETRLMSLALSAEQRGARPKARELYARILRDYPSSPLAPDARRGLERTK